MFVVNFLYFSSIKCKKEIKRNKKKKEKKKKKKEEIGFLQNIEASTLREQYFLQQMRQQIMKLIVSHTIEEIRGK